MSQADKLQVPGTLTIIGKLLWQGQSLLSLEPPFIQQTFTEPTMMMCLLAQLTG